MYCALLSCLSADVVQGVVLLADSIIFLVVQLTTQSHI
jgi:hypothetical protein